MQGVPDSQAGRSRARRMHSRLAENLLIESQEEVRSAGNDANGHQELISENSQRP
jgi:hypothetical protein